MTAVIGASGSIYRGLDRAVSVTSVIFASAVITTQCGEGEPPRRRGEYGLDGLVDRGRNRNAKM
jgi:hypothetical protein